MDYDPKDPAWALIDRLRAALQAAEDDGTLNDETFMQIVGSVPNARVVFETGQDQDENPLPTIEPVV